MASLYICCNFASVREDKLARNVSTKSSNTPIPSPAIFQAQILIAAQVFAPIPSLLSIYTNVDL